MEQQSAYLDLTILSAADLKRNWLSGDGTVAVAWVDLLSKKTTKVAICQGSNAEWHDKMTLSLNGADALAQGKRLTIEIHSRGKWGNSLLGTVYVPLVDLALDGQKEAKTILTYQIVQPSGKQNGMLNFLAKVVKPMANGPVVPLLSASRAVPLADNHLGSGFNTLYPLVGVTYPSVEIDDEAPSLAYLPYPIPESCPYSSHRFLLFQNRIPKGDAPCAPHSNYSSVAPYPPLAPQSSEAPYPPPTSGYPTPASPLSNPTTFLYPPIGPHSSEAPYPPTLSNPTTFLYPPIGPHSSEAPYPPTCMYRYPVYPISSLYPPPYPPEHV